MHNMMLEAEFDKDEVDFTKMFNTLASTELESGNANIVDGKSCDRGILRGRQTRTLLIASTHMRWLKSD